MAVFFSCFERTLALEGGYVLHEVAGDIGGQTYAGIARRFHPRWSGWPSVDSGDWSAAREQVVAFYRDHFWARIQGEKITDQDVCETLYDAAVNMGVVNAVRLAQIVVEQEVDGIVGPKTLSAVNAFDADHFLASFTVARVARRIEVVGRNPSQRKFLLGWIRRDISMGISG